MVMLVYQRVTIKKKALAVSHGLYSHHGMGILSHDTSDIRLKTPWPQNVRDPLEGFYGAILRNMILRRNFVFIPHLGSWGWCLDTFHLSH